MGINCCTGKSEICRSYYSRESQQFFDIYTLKKTIGRGSSAEVKLGFDNLKQKKVAIKVFDKAETINSQRFPHIMQQKLILEKLSSDNKFPFISHLIQCSQDHTNLYFVLEYFQHGNLRNLISTKKSFNIEQIKFITVCLLITLKALNEKGIIHGDLKPQNILINQHGYFCVADFSSAMFFGCKSTQIKGTKGYQAPQLLKKQKIKILNNKSDLYSLGAILWEMAYGMPYCKYKNLDNKNGVQMELTNDSFSDQAANFFVQNQQFYELVSLLLKENPEQRATIQSVERHPWLNLGNDRITLFKQRQVNPHPFSPVQQYFSYMKKQSSINSSKSFRNFSQYDDQLYRSVLLSQKKYQRMFAEFSEKNKKRTT